MASRIRLGLFDDDCEYDSIPYTECDTPVHAAAALKMARSSMVLLKNDGLLPLSKDSIRTIAVIGPNADDIEAQYGDWTYFTHPDPMPGRAAIRPYVTVKEGMEALCREKGVEMTYVKGCGVLPSPDDDLPAAG